MKNFHKLRFGVILALAFCMLLSLAACAEEEKDIMVQISQMTLREKIGQLFMVRPDALEKRFSAAELRDNDVIGTTRISEEMRALYQEYPCGGFTLFRRNIISPSQLRMFTSGLHALGTPAPMISIDEEGGRIARLANHPANFGVKKVLPMGKIAASGDETLAYEAGREIGTYLTAYGFDIDFAPVADVNTNPLNPVIGDRAFGDDPSVASRMIRQAIRGFHEGGVATCIKHFPGHGDTSTDTHTGYAETQKTWEEMLSCEMIPFRAGIEAGTDLVMTAHISAPAVTGSTIPSTMSSVILTEKLRGELGYDGLIITDALEMGAIMEKYSSAEASIACLEAGVDILLMPYDYCEAFDGIVEAVETGRLSVERIEQSVCRILRLKKTLAERAE